MKSCIRIIVRAGIVVARALEETAAGCSLIPRPSGFVGLKDFFSLLFCSIPHDVLFFLEENYDRRRRKTSIRNKGKEEFGKGKSVESAQGSSSAIDGGGGGGKNHPISSYFREIAVLRPTTHETTNVSWRLRRRSVVGRGKNKGSKNENLEGRRRDSSWQAIIISPPSPLHRPSPPPSVARLLPPSHFFTLTREIRLLLPTVYTFASS